MTLGHTLENPADDKGWIGVDLDGTLALYHGWHGLYHIGKPVPLMVGRIMAWLATGYEVRVFTARVTGLDAANRQTFDLVLGRWCQEAGLPALPATNIKDFRMVELWDDRAMQVEFNTGKVAAQQSRAKPRGIE